MSDSTQKYHELMASGYFDKKKVNETPIEVVAEALRIAEERHLTIEVVFTAFKIIQKKPKTSIEDALNISLLEWDLL